VPGGDPRLRERRAPSNLRCRLTAHLWPHRSWGGPTLARTSGRSVEGKAGDGGRPRGDVPLSCRASIEPFSSSRPSGAIRKPLRPAPEVEARPGRCRGSRGGARSRPETAGRSKRGLCRRGGPVARTDRRGVRSAGRTNAPVAGCSARRRSRRPGTRDACRAEPSTTAPGRGTSVVPGARAPRPPDPDAREKPSSRPVVFSSAELNRVPGMRGRWQPDERPWRCGRTT
jgi:hypothetical protein